MSLVFRALQLVNEQRNAYGLRSNDFTRYRKHCANRTHRLRSTLKMTHGKGREFKKLPPLTAEIVKDGHLQLLLFEAERAWAYAQELTNASQEPANEDNASSLRHSATGRFRRAVSWSTQLLSLCQTLHASSRMSTGNLIEVTVYTIILNGRFLRYRDEFSDALIQLSVARALLDQLAETSSTSRDQALAILFSDTIGPEIRYCAHELGRAKAYDVNGIVEEFAPKYRNEIVEGCDALIAKLQTEQKATSGISKLEERIWEGQPVPVRNPELVDVLLRVQAAEISLSRRDLTPEALKKTKLGATAYDAVLSAFSDAEEIARKLKESQQLVGGSTNNAIGGRDIHFVHAYIVYQLLSRRIQRDLLLVSTLLSTGGGEKQRAQITKKPLRRRLNVEPIDNRLYPAVVKLLDTVIQSLTQMRTLTIVDDNPDLASAVEARISFTNGRRCLYLARCYSTAKKYAEALTLLQHATIHVRETVSGIALSEFDLITNASTPFFPMYPESIKEFENEVLADGMEHKQDWFAYNGGSVQADPATHKKPLFFNIALNYVELDMDRLQLRSGKESGVVPSTGGTLSPIKTETVEKKSLPKAKAEEQRELTPSVHQTPRTGLGSLLGGWWSK